MSNLLDFARKIRPSTLGVEGSGPITEAPNTNRASKTQNNNKSSWLCGLSALLGPFRFLCSFCLNRNSTAAEKVRAANFKT